jgi:hypothetical protein
MDGKAIEISSLSGISADWCECGRPKMNRLMGIVTGCEACDEVITRHRCTGRPDIDDVTCGEPWECRDCGSVWTAAEEVERCPDCCADCGHEITVRRWGVVQGDRIDTAPRYVPPPSCYPVRSGAMVHVKPGCRCGQ